MLQLLGIKAEIPGLKLTGIERLLGKFCQFRQLGLALLLRAARQLIKKFQHLLRRFGHFSGQ